jgi:hypothetical protein
MNYIELINRFWIVNAEYSFTGNEAKLYFYLLHISNSLGWKNPFRQSDGQISLGTGISCNSIKSGRNRLAQAGLIAFKNGKQGNQNVVTNKTLYELIGVSKIDSPTAPPTVPPTVPPTECPTVPPMVEVNKQNKTKPKEERPPSPPPEENSVKVKPKKPQPDALQFPVVSEKFLEVWNQLAAMPNWKKKLPVSLQMSLDKLAKYDEAFSIELMKRAIEGNYRGVVFNDTDTAYLKWKSQKGKPGQIMQPKDEERRQQLLKRFL